jgi:ABC-type glycerol-3-phosphate transport system permease component
MLKSPRTRWNQSAVYAGFILFTLIVLLPVYWMLRSSLAAGPDLIKLPLIYFPSPTLKNFETLLTQIPFAQYVSNSLIFALATTLVSLTVSYLAGITLVLSSTLAPFTVWVLVSFIKQVPYEIEEAAIIDGASLPQIIWHILLPVTKPGLVTMGLINFINAWNNLLYPLSFTTSPVAKTLSVAITEVFAGYSPWGKPWELIMAVGVTMTIPMVILVLLSQKAIVRGLTAGSLK